MIELSNESTIPYWHPYFPLNPIPLGRFRSFGHHEVLLSEFDGDHSSQCSTHWVAKLL